MRSLKVFSRLIPLVLALLGWPAPSNAYRLSQAVNSGQATGRQVRANDVTCNDRFGFEHWNSRTMNLQLSDCPPNSQEVARPYSILTMTDCSIAYSQKSSGRAI